MTSLFQQKQHELLLAASRVEELSDQLEALRSGRVDPPLLLPSHHHHQHAATVELECLYKELQVRQKSVKLAQPAGLCRSHLPDDSTAEEQAEPGPEWQTAAAEG